MVAHRVCQSSDGVVEYEEILVLVLSEGKHQRVQDEAQIGNQLRARLLLQGGERTVRKQTRTTSVKSLSFLQTLRPMHADCGSDMKMGTKCIIADQ